MNYTKCSTYSLPKLVMLVCNKGELSYRQVIEWVHLHVLSPRYYILFSGGPAKIGNLIFILQIIALQSNSFWRRPPKLMGSDLLLKAGLISWLNQCLYGIHPISLYHFGRSSLDFLQIVSTCLIQGGPKWYLILQLFCKCCMNGKKSPFLIFWPHPFWWNRRCCLGAEDTLSGNLGMSLWPALTNLCCSSLQKLSN